MISLLQGPGDFKEVTTIMERLLRTSSTTILKRIFEIRKESNDIVAIDESHHSCKNTPRQSHFDECVDSLSVGPGKCVSQKDYWRCKCPQMVVFKIY